MCKLENTVLMSSTLDYIWSWGREWWDFEAHNSSLFNTFHSELICTCLITSLYCISELFMRGRSRKKGQVSMSLKMWYTTKKGKNWDFTSSNSTCSHLIFFKFHTTNMSFTVLALIFLNKRQLFSQHQRAALTLKTQDFISNIKQTYNILQKNKENNTRQRWYWGDGERPGMAIPYTWGAVNKFVEQTLTTLVSF